MTAIRNNSSPKAMQNKLADFHGSDIADVLPDLTQQERKRLFRIYTADMLSEIFEYIDEEDARTYLPEMDARKAAAVVSRLETDTAADILHELPRDYRELIIELLPDDIKNELRIIATFDENEIGSHLTTNCIIIKDDISVKAAMKEVVRQAADNDNISTIFVVDEYGAFCGAIDLRDLITSQNSGDLDSLMMTSFPYVYGNEETDECLERLKDYSESSVPVLDATTRISGVITARSMIEVVDDEMSEDYARLAGLTSEEDLHEPLKQSMVKRLPWLMVLLCLGLVVSGVVGAFESVISQLTLIMA
ncbi:MAG: magnesium transporter, partial [Oscillospiraceae bacterium]|nr:magnesium transporter [Oscillospiraceae bacterium]